MKAKKFLGKLNARATANGGLNLDVLARHIAETIEEISEAEASDALHNLTKPELQELAEKKGLPTSGTKDEIIDRLEAANL